jgi:hypothetical protein
MQDCDFKVWDLEISLSLGIGISDVLDSYQDLRDELFDLCAVVRDLVTSMFLKRN